MGAFAHAAASSPLGRGRGGGNGLVPLQRLLEVAHTSLLDIGFNNLLAYLCPQVKRETKSIPTNTSTEAENKRTDEDENDGKKKKLGKQEWIKRCEYADALSVTTEHLSSLDEISSMCGGWNREQRFPDPWHRASPGSCGYEAEAIAYTLRRVPVEGRERCDDVNYDYDTWHSQENTTPVRGRHKTVMRNTISLWRFWKNMQWHVAGNTECLEVLAAAGRICSSENVRFSMRLTRRFTHYLQYCTNKELDLIQKSMIINDTEACSCPCCVSRNGLK